MTTTERRIYRDGPTDGTRWDHFTHRPGDIIIATPAKCGTTWTQTIVASLLFPNGDVPGPVIFVSPWIDGRIEPIEQVEQRLESQEHRRFIKTHTPADGVPFWPTTSYVVVLRDGRDAFMSLDNHVKKMRPEFVEQINKETDRDGGTQIAWSDDAAVAFPIWLETTDAVPSWLATWWPLHSEPNVLFVHYNDLKADLDGEMRRIASFLQIDVPESLWPAVVERCTFESMKARPDEIGPFEFAFEGGAQSFLFKGTNGRWGDVLKEPELDLYAKAVAELPDEARTWLESGAIASGVRP